MEESVNLTEFLYGLVPIVTALVGYWANKKFLWFKTTRFKLSSHPMFTDLLTSRREIRSWVVAENRQVFTDALTIKFSVWREEGIKLAEKLQKGNYNNTKLVNEIINWANETVLLYTKEWEDSGIPKKVIDRITTVHEEKVEQFIAEIKLIVNDNDMYPFKMQKVIAVFGTLRMLLIDTKNDFNRLVYREVYNGAFVGCCYKGIPVSDTEYKEYVDGKKN